MERDRVRAKEQLAGHFPIAQALCDQVGDPALGLGEAGPAKVGAVGAPPVPHPHAGLPELGPDARHAVGAALPLILLVRFAQPGHCVATVASCRQDAAGVLRRLGASQWSGVGARCPVERGAVVLKQASRVGSGGHDVTVVGCRLRQGRGGLGELHRPAVISARQGASNEKHRGLRAGCRVLLEHHFPQVFFEVTDVGARVDFCWSWHSAVPRDSPAIVNDLTPRRTRVLGPAEQDCQVGGCARAERWASVRLTEPGVSLAHPQEAAMPISVGIDLGTTNSVIATTEAGHPTVIPNAEGSRTTPSVVAFTGHGERLVGQLARRQAILNPKGTIYSAKRFIGRRYDEVTSEQAAVSFDVVPGPDGTARFEVNGKQYAPEEISALVLRKLAEDASKFVGEKVTEAVITVPAYFNDAQRHATKDAGKIAGLEVLRIINEPTAAALAYGLDKKQNETVLVFDLGGGTFDVSVLDIGDGVIEVRATSGDTHLGGDDFDRRLVDFLADEFNRDNGIDLRDDPQALQRLFEAAEKAKVELSSVTQTSVSLPFITADASGPKHLNTTVMRSTFDQITADLVERTVEPVKQAMADAKLTDADIDEVILVGGATRTPSVQNQVRRLTGGKDP